MLSVVWAVGFGIVELTPALCGTGVVRCGYLTAGRVLRCDIESDLEYQNPQLIHVINSTDSAPKKKPYNESQDFEPPFIQPKKENSTYL